MNLQIPFLVLALLVFLPISYTKLDNLSKGSFLSVEKQEDVLVSHERLFSAGFHPVGDNAFCFAIWFNKPLKDGNRTIVWMANRDKPVNGRLSKLSLLGSGNLILTDAAQETVWSTDSNSELWVELRLLDNGNLILVNSNNQSLWQSFHFPTDSLLPTQPLTRDTKLVSKRSQTNYSSGFYSLSFDNDNVLRLLYEGPEISSIYWPPPWLNSWESGRSTYNSSKTAVIDALGHFQSSDTLNFSSSDYGLGLQRRLTLDVDGNIRMYTLDEERKEWHVSWQAIFTPCIIHGICGPNAICSYHPQSGRRCSCVPGYKIKNYTEWSYGCEPDFKFSGNASSKIRFLQLPHVEFYGYDIGFFQNYTLDRCKKLCMKYSDCKGFQYKVDSDNGIYNCFPKTLLFNGYRSVAFDAPVYLKLPKDYVIPSEETVEKHVLNCSRIGTIMLDRAYEKKDENGIVKFMLWFAGVLGGIELVCVCFFLFITRQQSRANRRGYFQAPTGFKRFTYAELKKASRNFSDEIGRGGSGIVYRAVFENRAAAIKLLKDSNQGEAEFLAEVSTIGRLNHMNLMEILGYCAEGKRRLLVYEYMDHGSLSENLHSDTLDWEKRFNIAVGTAKGLAYIHEESLEWFLHCDVKPQNILLDRNYEPKVADFGLSKLIKKDANENSKFSTIRGTRGYMAPEWVFNLPITSKVDVYSYGIVVLEMITGRSPMGIHSSVDVGGLEQRRLVIWVREKMQGEKDWIEEIVDPSMNGEYDRMNMEVLVKVALQCAEEDKNCRPSMGQVVGMLLHREEE